MPSLGYQALMLLSWILVASKETDESIGHDDGITWTYRITITRVPPDDDGGAEATIRKGRDGYAVASGLDQPYESVD